MLFSLLYFLVRRLLRAGSRLDEKDIELLVLRHQVKVLRRQVKRPRLHNLDRVLLAAASRALRRSAWSSFVVRPENLLHWHRELVRRKWTYRSRGHPGRPPIVPPAISDFSPRSGHFRRLVVITGSGFTGSTSVRFNGRPAPFNVVSDAQIRARVPSGAGTGPIRVTNPEGFDVSNIVFHFLRFQHRIVVSMQLNGHLTAFGRIGVPDGTRMCRARRTVTIQRFISGRFRFVGRGRSQLDGDYRIGVGDKAGRYRAVVSQKLTPNHRCRPDVSLVRTHRHPPPDGGGGGGGGGGGCTPGYSPCLPQVHPTTTAMAGAATDPPTHGPGSRTGSPDPTPSASIRITTASDVSRDSASSG